LTFLTVKGMTKESEVSWVRLKDEVAIVTGGGGGIGEGICHCLAREGAAVVVSDVNQGSADAVAGKIRRAGGKALSLKTDVRRAEECQALIDVALREMGRIDLLVCCAGVNGLDVEADSPGLIENISEQNWNLVVDVNLKGVFWCNRAIAPYFKKQKNGKIINIASIAGRKGIDWIPHYSATKAGVIVFTQAVALQLAPYNVTANTVCPGIVWTPLWDSGAKAISHTYPEFRGMSPSDIFGTLVERMIPLKRPQSAEDMGNAVVFLASKEADQITGQALNVDGGMVFS
jgi:meso-butanediol dehydrogenase/(S,S)-butanediol dehydrogenase/diacetyl reductase